ncbi:hypothetical protein [Desulfobacterium sp. N47]|uniref:Uncharacterized protein n=1 Tax=uncultured Desulfobacterium sp. TaxID=201089 RepID=E1YE43_9BACT|nr:unknown protein [uncultured Desulfobacterium sp.]
MTEKTEKAKRPASITIICIIGFIGAIYIVPLVFSSKAQQVGSWYPPYLVFSIIIGLVCIAGLWIMKKWAAYTYTAFLVLNQIVLLAIGAWSVVALLIPAVVIFFVLKDIAKPPDKLPPSVHIR